MAVLWSTHVNGDGPAKATAAGGRSSAAGAPPATGRLVRHCSGLWSLCSLWERDIGGPEPGVRDGGRAVLPRTTAC
jgi:hypothetical protein